MLKILRNGKIRVRTDIRRHLNVCIKVVEDAEGGARSVTVQEVTVVGIQQPAGCHSSIPNMGGQLGEKHRSLLPDCEIFLMLQHHRMYFTRCLVLMKDFYVDQSVIGKQV